MPDDLDRLFERLVRVLADEAPGRLAVPFPAAEVYERLVPYRSNRSALKVATHQDYEMAVLRLLSGERGYVALDPAEVQEALRREAAEGNPDPALFRQFPDAVLSLNRLAAERFLRGDRVYAPPSLVPTDAHPSPPLRDAQDVGAPEEEAAGDAPGSAFELAEQSESPRQCPYCGETLPGGRKVNFCPQCGQPPSGELRCPACGSEVDVGWRYCDGCGLDLERLPYSADHYLKTKETLPDGAFRHLRDDVDAIFLGALGDPRVPGNEHARDILLGLRFRLD